MPFLQTSGDAFSRGKSESMLASTVLDGPNRTPFFPKPETCRLSWTIGWMRWVSDREAAIYRELFELFLHQGTITSIAFAVVPWMA